MLVWIRKWILIPSLFLFFISGIIWSKIQWMSCTLKTLRGDIDITINLILRIKIMTITSSTDNLTGFLGCHNQVFDDLFNIIHAGKSSLMNLVDIVFWWLNFNEVIGLDDFEKFFFPFGCGSLPDFTIQTSRTDDQVSAICLKQTTWGDWSAIFRKIRSVGKRDKFIQILQTIHVLDIDSDMERM